MSSVLGYLRELKQHLVALVTSSAPVALLSLSQWFGWWTPPPWGYASAVAAIFLVAPYYVWKKERDTLNALLDLRGNADFIAQILIESNYWWGTGCNVPAEESAAAKWCSDYDAWMVGLKERVSARLGQTEDVLIFQIGSDLAGVRPTVGVTNEQQRRMSFLDHHMRRLRQAAERYQSGTGIT